MKKFFTLIAATLMAVCASAQGSYTPTATDKADTEISVGTDLSIKFLNNTSKGSVVGSGSWTFADGSTKGDQNALELQLVVKAGMELAIHFNGDVANNKAINMTFGDAGVSGKTIKSGDVVESGGLAPNGIAKGNDDGIVYRLAPETYIFYVGGTKWNFKSLSYEPATVDGIKNIAAEAKNAKTFNLAGQVVDASYNGVVIKNGTKMIQK